ncbi:MAG: urease accessory protein UreF, partial [Clostridia bacterium]|nr:urease accessory protein UreF [Clostridia bacterium]
HVVKSPQEIRDASIKLGSRFVKTISTTTEIQFESDIFNRYADKVNSKDVVPNHAIAYGVFCAAIGVDKTMALSFYLYAATSAMVTNSVKAVPLSQTQGQQILYKCSKLFNGIIEKVKTLDESKLGLSMPGFDIRCMQHEALYSRLYMS